MSTTVSCKQMASSLLTGEVLLGAGAELGGGSSFHGLNPMTGEELEPAYRGATENQISRACELADAAFASYRETSSNVRAEFLELIAETLSGLESTLVDRAMLETGLPRTRLEREVARTAGQLRLFAEVVLEGSWQGVRVEPALAARVPMPRPELRLRNIPLGPVAVFGASNFPFAYSVAGGDTASALAAGCPVVVKAHPAHPGTSELVGRAIQSAVKQCNLHEGVFSMVAGRENEVGMRLVSDSRIKAVGFTGSRTGGLALMNAAACREEPIPVFAEMSSINPVILLPAALQSRSEELSRDFVSSLTLGAGQFCTNPGLILVLNDSQLDSFLKSVRDTLSVAKASTMLHPGIFQSYQEGVDRLSRTASVTLLGRGQASSGENQCCAALFMTDDTTFLGNRSLHSEVFGATSLIVVCEGLNGVLRVLQQMEGQLTTTIHMNAEDLDAARALLPVIETKAGRLIVNDWPTGVEVGYATVHGGPFPSTSDARSTSVGSLAIHRFLRPVCYQSFTEELLPGDLRKSTASCCSDAISA